MTEMSRRLRAIDQLTVDVVTDDVSDNYVSERHCSAGSEFANIVRAAQRRCCRRGAAAPISALAAGWCPMPAASVRSLPFDTGPEGAIFVRNCADLAIELGEIECDRGQPRALGPHGRLAAALQAIREQGGRPQSTSIPERFNERAIGLGSGTVVPAAKVPRRPRWRGWVRQSSTIRRIAFWSMAFLFRAAKSRG